MAKCPTCNKKFPVLKVGLLSKAYPGLTCSSCLSYSEANKSQLMQIGLSGAVIGVFLLRWTYNLYLNNSKFWYVGLIATAVYFVGMVYLQSKIIVLKTAVNPDLETEAPIEKEVTPVPNKLDEPIDHLKYVYRNYSEKQLLEIATENGYRKEAKQAARDLLRENYGKEIVS